MKEKLKKVEGKYNNKRFYGIYIYEILITEASEDAPIKTEDIKRELQNEFDVEMDETTITRYLREFRQGKSKVYTLHGNGKEGYYLKNDYNIILSENEIFSDNEINFLYLSVLNSRQLSKKEKSTLIWKLSNQCTNEVIKDNLDYLVLTNTEKGEGVDGYSNLNTFIDAIKNKYPIQIMTKHDSRYRKFYLYAYIPASDGNIFLIGSYGGPRVHALSTSGILSFEVLNDSKFPDIKPVIEYGWFFDRERVEYLEKNYKDTFIYPSESQKNLQDKLYEINKLNRKLTFSRNYNEEDAKKLISCINSVLLLRHFKSGNRNIFAAVNNFLYNSNKVLLDYKISSETIARFLIYSSLLALPREEFEYYCENNKLKDFVVFVESSFEQLRAENENVYTFALDWFNSSKSIREISEEHGWDTLDTVKYKDIVLLFFRRTLYSQAHQFYKTLKEN